MKNSSHSLEGAVQTSEREKHSTVLPAMRPMNQDEEQSTALPAVRPMISPRAQECHLQLRG